MALQLNESQEGDRVLEPQVTNREGESVFETPITSESVLETPITVQEDG